MVIFIKLVYLSSVISAKKQPDSQIKIFYFQSLKLYLNFLQVFIVFQSQYYNTLLLANPDP